MANDALVEHILSALGRASPTERVVLKMAAALVKQMDQDYDIEAETDQRIKLTLEEMDWIPDRFEVWYGVVRPKHWETPERLAAAARHNAGFSKLSMKRACPTSKRHASMRGVARSEERKYSRRRSRTRPNMAMRSSSVPSEIGGGSSKLFVNPRYVSNK